MFMNGDPLHTRSLAPQPPLPPEIEGYLKKLKRKTSNITGSWNKRWFFVDPKRLEFGYAASKAPNAPRSSIYLNDITAVLQFDDTHFQIESRTRNFFLCGESKASTTCWVKSLDEYRKKLIEYDREMLKIKASAPRAGSTSETNQSKPSAESSKSTSQRKKKPSLHDNPARDSLQDSSSSASLSISASSSSNLAEEKLPRHVNVDDIAASDEKRTPSPIDSSRRRERRESKSRGTAAPTADRVQESDSKSRDRTRNRDGDRESRDRRSRDSERDRERGTRDRARDRDDDERSSKRDRSSSAQRRGNTGGSSGTSSQGSTGRTGSRTNSGKSAYGGHPTHGYVMHAWMDEYE